jgi:hypothetical protein
MLTMGMIHLQMSPFQHGLLKGRRTTGFLTKIWEAFLVSLVLTRILAKENCAFFFTRGVPYSSYTNNFRGFHHVPPVNCQYSASN